MANSSLRHLLNEDQCLYFLHIPKTAGTTFTAILHNQFNPNEICPATRWYSVLEIPSEALSQYHVIAGHMTYSLHRVIQKRLIYITMLRDPIERAISYYEQVRRMQPHYPYKKFYTQNMSLEDFIVDPEINFATTNAAVMMIGENYSLEQVRNLFAIRNYDDDFTPPPTPTREFLERAKQRLEEFAFVGLAERFADSINLLTYTFAWHPIGATQELNKSRGRIKREDLPQRTIDAIIEQNQLDIELYEFAKALFERRYRHMMEELLDLDYRHLYATPKEMVDTLEVDFSKALPGTGWQPSEPDNPGFRWTGPSTVSTLELPLRQDKELLLTFRIVTTIAQDILDSFRVEVNNTPVALAAEVFGTLPGIKLSAKLTPELLASSNAFTRISFHVNRTISPREIWQNNSDERLLGVAIADFRIMPYISEDTITSTRKP